MSIHYFSHANSLLFTNQKVTGFLVISTKRSAWLFEDVGQGKDWQGNAGERCGI